MTRVLVTGASGFVGRHALPLLVARGDDVHAVIRRPVPSMPGVTAHSCDLLDDHAGRTLIERLRPAALLHLAWYAVPGKFWTAPENSRWLSSSLGLVRHFAAAGGRRVVVAGTCAEYDWSHGLLSEADTPLAPATPYGTSKNGLRAALEHEAPGWGVSWAWGRIFFVYGPHEARGRLVSDVIAGLLTGQRVAVSEGRQERDFMHVADTARAFVDLLGSDVTGPVNIASGIAVPVRHVIEQIGALTGRAELIDYGARPTPPGEPPRLAADVDRLRALGFMARYDLAGGLAQTVEWWRRSAG